MAITTTSSTSSKAKPWQASISWPRAAYDAVFIDADKGNYANYLRKTLGMLKPGGLMMVDTLAYGHILEEGNCTDDVWAIRAFNDFMAGKKASRRKSYPWPTACGWASKTKAKRLPYFQRFRCP